MIEEAQEIAVRDHHMEYKSNMWIGIIYRFDPDNTKASVVMN